MTAAAIPLRLFTTSQQCEECPTIIPAGKRRCYFHERPPELRTNRPLHERRLDHVMEHLREQDRPFLPWLLEPLTLEQIAEQMGSGWTVRQVEHALDGIRKRMLPDRRSAKPALQRLSLLRIVSGMDRCWCDTVSD